MSELIWWWDRTSNPMVVKNHRRSIRPLVRFYMNKIIRFLSMSQRPLGLQKTDQPIDSIFPVAMKGFPDCLSMYYMWSLCGQGADSNGVYFCDFLREFCVRKWLRILAWFLVDFCFADKCHVDFVQCNHIFMELWSSLCRAWLLGSWVRTVAGAKCLQKQ